MTFSVWKISVTLISILLYTGCWHQLPNIKNSPPAQAISPELSTAFAYPINLNSITETPLEAKDNYSVSLFSFQSSIDLLNPSKKPHNITLEVYRPLKQKIDCPILIILPISGGSYGISRYFARSFVSEGWNCVLVKRRKIYKKMITVELLNPIMRQMTIDHRQAIDWAERQKSVDPEKIAVLGVSQGGLKAISLSAADPRIKASIFALAGGDMAHILAYSEENGVIRNRNKYLEKHKIGVEEFHAAIKENYKYDPLDLAPFIDANKSMIILANLDNCVPYESGKKLYHALPGSEKITLLAGHYSALLMLPYINYKAHDFFRRKLLNLQEK